MKVNRKKSVEIQEFDHNKENELPINAALDAIATPSGPGKPLENVKTVKDLLNERKEANESDLQKAKKKAHRQKRMLQVLATIAIIGLLILSPDLALEQMTLPKQSLGLAAMIAQNLSHSMSEGFPTPIKKGRRFMFSQTIPSRLLTKRGLESLCALPSRKGVRSSLTSSAGYVGSMAGSQPPSSSATLSG